MVKNIWSRVASLAGGKKLIPSQHKENPDVVAPASSGSNSVGSGALPVAMDAVEELTFPQSRYTFYRGLFYAVIVSLVLWAGLLVLLRTLR
jgi:hypothetical protein